MKVETQKVGPCKVKLLVKLEADETRKEYETVMGQFMRQGRVPGFRQGKVPREIIKRDFFKEIKEEVQGRLFRAYYRQALEQQGVSMVALLDVSDMLFSPETGLMFSMTVDVPPVFDLPKYKKIPLTFETAAVTEQQVDEHIDRLRKALAKFEDALPEHVIDPGDLVSIDYVGKIDGVPLSAVTAEAKAISEGVDFWVMLEEGRFLPEIIAALVGLKSGEEKSVEVAFDQAHALEALRGKKALYQVKVKSVRRRTLLTDEALLEQLKIASLEALRNQTRDDLSSMAQQNEKQRQEQVIIDFLLKKCEFDLPSSEVSDEINQTLDRLMNDARYRGLTKEHLEQNREAIIENATTSAKRQVRLRYILDAIAQQEALVLSDEELDDKIKQLSQEFRMKPEQLRAQIEKNERLELLRKQTLNEKTVRYLLEQLKR